MDVILFTGILVICLILIALGLYKYRILVSVAGVTLLLLALTAQGEGLTQKVVANETDTLVYGNQTNNIRISNESFNGTSLPFNVTLAYRPVVANSLVCYYLSNTTVAGSYVVNGQTGLIVIKG